SPPVTWSPAASCVTRSRPGLVRSAETGHNSRVNPELIIALASGGLSIIATAMGAQATKKVQTHAADLERQRKQEDASEQARLLLHQYRDPLLDAAHTLQGRLFNIIAQRYLVTYFDDDVEEYERAYARDYTAFAIAEYLCWVEIVRRELRFRDFGD